MTVRSHARTSFPDFSDAAPSLASVGDAIRSRAAAFATRLATNLERRHQRAQLAALEDQLLRDIDVTRVDALREAGKPFWT
jgi:uncharacterized protein YjiS (DUF1127 family)